MYRRILTIALLAVLAAGAAKAEDYPVSYDIEVTLEPADHRLGGRESIRWTNTTAVEVQDVFFHLYLNAFASSETTFMRELGDGSLRALWRPELDWGWTRITALTTPDGVDLLPELSFERPDDGNMEDFTVARVVLPEPVLPGQSLHLELRFEARLPRVIARTGYAGDFHLVGQWYPKLGVFEEQTAAADELPRGAWNCHQFHANSEFFADFASYRVQVEVPEGWLVGASGVELWNDVVNESGSPRHRVEYRADGVHDFAWCAAPAELMEVVESEFDPRQHVPAAWLEQARARLGLGAADLELPPLHLRLIVPRSQTMLADRMLHALRLGIAWYGLLYGPYPYPQLTVVSPPPGAEEAGGMEYPTFITTGASRAMATPLGSWRPSIEQVTIHEFGHQYFQGMLASNEFEEPWLDEGLTSYTEVSCMEAVAEGGLVPEMASMGFWAMERLQMAAIREPVRVDRQAWEFRRRLDYFRASYGKAALVLKNLAGLVGEDVFARAMRGYVERYRFAHPRGRDFMTAIEEVAQQDLSWYFDQALGGDATADWSVRDVRQRQSGAVDGMRWTGEVWEERSAADEPAGDSSWQVEVDLGREGEFIGPVEVDLEFADGRVERRRWDGPERWVRWEITSEQPLHRVIVDPRGIWCLETRRRDNYWKHPDAEGRANMLPWWLRTALELAAVAVLPWS